MDEGFKYWKLIIVSVISLVVFFLTWELAIAPIYNVWEQGQVGKATLERADYDRQTKVVEAQANLQAEKLNAEAEVIRAGGVAKSNEIVKNSINDEYIRYLWVKTLDGAQKEIIYVPTESNLPITEATRLQTPSK